MIKTRMVLGSMVLLIVLGLLLAACGGAQDPATDLDGQALAQERCSQCHAYERVSSAQKSAAEWESTVERMIGLGAQLNETEKAAVIGYLSEAYPE